MVNSVVSEFHCYVCIAAAIVWLWIWFLLDKLLHVLILLTFLSGSS